MKWFTLLLALPLVLALIGNSFSRRRQGWGLTDRKFLLPVITARDFTLGQATPLFQLQDTQWSVPGGAYGCDVTPDGQRFLVARRMEARDAVPLTVTTNWTSLLTKK